MNSNTQLESTRVGRRIGISAGASAAGFGMVIAMATPTLAHVGVETHGVTPTAGSSSSIFLRPGHGCDGDATNSVSVTLPAGITTVKPQPKAGWRLTQKDGVITWSGGVLADDQFDEFGLRVSWPKLAPGATSQQFAFQTVQTCDAELQIARSGSTATVSGMLPHVAGEKVDLFVDDVPLTVRAVTVAPDGSFTVATAAKKVPPGARVTARQEGRIVGTSTSATEAWIDLPTPGSNAVLAMPAPLVTVVAPSAPSGH